MFLHPPLNIGHLFSPLNVKPCDLFSVYLQVVFSVLRWILRSVRRPADRPQSWKEEASLNILSSWFLPARVFQNWAVNHRWLLNRVPEQKGGSSSPCMTAREHDQSALYMSTPGSSLTARKKHRGHLVQRLGSSWALIPFSSGFFDNKPVHAFTFALVTLYDLT